MLSRESVSAHICQPDANLLDRAGGIQRELHRNRSRGKVADLSLQLKISAAAFWRRNRNTNLSKDLVVLQRCGKERDKEIINRITRSPLAPVATTCAPNAIIVAG